MKKTARRHLKKSPKSAYHKEVNPDLPVPENPVPAALKKRLPLVLIIAVLLVILLIAGGLTIWKINKNQQPVKPKLAPRVADFIPASTPTPTPSLLSIICPTVKSFCQNKDLYNKGSLSIKATKDLPVIAVFDGQIEIHNYTSLNPTDPFYLIILTNKNKTYQAVYYINGAVRKVNKQVRAGQRITDTKGQPLTFKDNSTFTFEIKQIGKTLEPVYLFISNFKK